MTGPCGPCSEIYYDLGDDYASFGHDERFVEIWNLVFMQFEKTETGIYQPLAKCNIDTGAGLERIATIVQGVHNSFETDELVKIKTAIAKGFSELSGRKIVYLGVKAETDAERKTDLYLKIVTDHIRCLAFLIADGVRPSNLGRGYVLRMIIRRAARFAYLLTGISGAQLYQYTNIVCDSYGAFYTELLKNKDLIKDICEKEEEQFTKTIAKGMFLLESELAKSKNLSGAFIFDLYSTYGFPLELTEEIAIEAGATLDLAGYEAAKAKHSEASSTEAFAVAAVDKAKLYGALIAELGATKFLGYEQEEAEAKVLAIIDTSGNRVQRAEAEATLILDQSPFYAESGGQEGDRGRLILRDDELSGVDVTDTKKFQGLILHQIRGSLKVGDKVIARVDHKTRTMSRYHHSACHLLQAALRKVLGKQLQQAGSQVGHEYTRFDFNFERALKPEELEVVEDQINTWIKAGYSVETKLMRYQDAIKAGALAFFEDKYDVDAEVRVLKMGEASTELCGGTHVTNIADIGFVIIASESSVAAGIRRIKMFAAEAAKQYLAAKSEAEAKAAEQETMRKSAEQVEKQRKQLLLAETLKLVPKILAKAKIEALGTILVEDVSSSMSELDADILKSLTEAVAKQLSSSDYMIALVAGQADKVSMVVAISDTLVRTGLNAGNLVREAAKICGGGGGGRANFAQAGAKDCSKIGEALSFLRASINTVNV